MRRTVVIVIIAQYIATPYCAPSAMSLFPPKYRSTQPCSRLPSAPRYWLGMVPIAYLGGKGPLSQGVQARRKALRIRFMDGMKVRKKRPRGFKKRPRGFK